MMRARFVTWMLIVVLVVGCNKQEGGQQPAPEKQPASSEKQPENTNNAKSGNSQKSTIADEESAVSALKKKGAETLEEFNGGKLRIVSVDLTKANPTAEDVSQLSKIHYLSAVVIHKQDTTDSVLKALRENGQLHMHTLVATTATSGSCKKPEEVTNVNLMNAKKVGVQGLKEFAILPNVETIWLSDTPAADEWIKELKVFPKLKWLNLDETIITDEGITELAKLKQLKKLDIRRTKVSDKAVKEFQAALPECAVTR